MEICIIDLRNVSLTKELVEEAALHACESEKHVILLQDFSVHDFHMFFPQGFKLRYVTNTTLSLKTLSLFFSLDSKIPHVKVFKYTGDVFQSNEENFGKFHTFRKDTITDVIENVESIKNQLLQNIHDENAKNEFELFLNIIMSIKYTERKVIMGSSLLNISELNLRVDDTVENILKMQEVSKLRDFYSQANQDNLNMLNTYIHSKDELLANYQEHNFDSSGELNLTNSYPRAYKYLSTYIYICAEENKRANNLSVAYLLFFRVFETYCEGALVVRQLAKISENQDKGASFLLKKVNGTFFCPMGFGHKWGAIQERSNLLSSCSEETLTLFKKHKDLRNIMIYTHGDFIVNSELLLELKDVVMTIIESMEVIMAQNSFRWNSVIEEMKKVFLYNPILSAADIIMNKYTLVFEEFNSSD
jgi:hypothetical protein